MSRIQYRYVQAVAGLMFGLSLFMPFAKATAVFVGTLNVSGLDKLQSYDKLVVALVAAGLVFLAYRGNAGWRGIILGAAAVGLAVYYYSQVSGNAADANAALSSDGTSYGVASVGFGIYVMLASAVAATIAGFGLRKKIEVVTVDVEA